MTAKNVSNGKPDAEALEERGQYASPPCYQHEIDPLYQGISEGTNLPGDEVTTNSARAERSDKSQDMQTARKA